MSAGLAGSSVQVPELLGGGSTRSQSSLAPEHAECLVFPCLVISGHVFQSWR
jgi:hypothetical protein